MITVGINILNGLIKYLKNNGCFIIMKIIIRKSNNNDLNDVFNLHNLCFSFNDRWYKNAISQYINNSIIITTENENIIGVLLQGNFMLMTPNEQFTPYIHNFINENKIYKSPSDEEVSGIVMICIHPDFRNQGLATKLIEHHNKLNNDSSYLCTRLSNNNAISLYLKNGYKNIGIIKDKYYLPIEDGYIMVRDN